MPDIFDSVAPSTPTAGAGGDIFDHVAASAASPAAPKAAGGDIFDAVSPGPSATQVAPSAPALTPQQSQSADAFINARMPKPPTQMQQIAAEQARMAGQQQVAKIVAFEADPGFAPIVPQTVVTNPQGRPLSAFEREEMRREVDASLQKIDANKGKPDPFGDLKPALTPAQQIANDVKNAPGYLAGAAQRVAGEMFTGAAAVAPYIPADGGNPDTFVPQSALPPHQQSPEAMAATSRAMIQMGDKVIQAGEERQAQNPVNSPYIRKPIDVGVSAAPYIGAGFTGPFAPAAMAIIGGAQSAGSTGYQVRQAQAASGEDPYSPEAMSVSGQASATMGAIGAISTFFIPGPKGLQLSPSFIKRMAAPGIGGAEQAMFEGASQRLVVAAATGQPVDWDSLPEEIVTNIAAMMVMHGVTKELPPRIQKAVERYRQAPQQAEAPKPVVQQGAFPHTTRRPPPEAQPAPAQQTPVEAPIVDPATRLAELERKGTNHTIKGPDGVEEQVLAQFLSESERAELAALRANPPKPSQEPVPILAKEDAKPAELAAPVPPEQVIELQSRLSNRNIVKTKEDWDATAVQLARSLPDGATVEDDLGSRWTVSRQHHKSGRVTIMFDAEAENLETGKMEPNNGGLFFVDQKRDGTYKLMGDSAYILTKGVIKLPSAEGSAPVKAAPQPAQRPITPVSSQMPAPPPGFKIDAAPTKPVEVQNPNPSEAARSAQAPEPPPPSTVGEAPAQQPSQVKDSDTPPAPSNPTSANVSTVAPPHTNSNAPDGNTAVQGVSSKTQPPPPDTKPKSQEWEMTPEEYGAAFNLSPEDAKRLHYSEVQLAVNRGERVPTKILELYKDAPWAAKEWRMRELRMRDAEAEVARRTENEAVESMRSSPEYEEAYQWLYDNSPSFRAREEALTEGQIDDLLSPEQIRSDQAVFARAKGTGKPVKLDALAGYPDILKLYGANAASAATITPQGASNDTTAGTGTARTAGDRPGVERRGETAGTPPLVRPSVRLSPEESAARLNAAVEGIRKSIAGFRGHEVELEADRVYLKTPDGKRVPWNLVESMPTPEGDSARTYINSLRVATKGQKTVKVGGREIAVPDSAEAWAKMPAADREALHARFSTEGFYDPNTDTITTTYNVGRDPTIGAEEVGHRALEILKKIDPEGYKRRVETRVRGKQVYADDEAIIAKLISGRRGGGDIFDRIRKGTFHQKPDTTVRLTPKQKAENRLIEAAESEGVLMSDAELETFVNDIGGLHPDVLSDHYLRDANGKVRRGKDGEPLMTQLGHRLAKWVDEGAWSEVVDKLGPKRAEAWADRVIETATMTRAEKLRKAAEHYANPNAPAKVRADAETVLGRKVEAEADMEPALPEHPADDIPFAVRDRRAAFRQAVQDINDQQALRERLDGTDIDDQRKSRAIRRVSSTVSTRKPTAIRAQEDPLSHNRLLINQDAMSRNPELLKTNVDLMTRYDNFRRLQKGLTTNEKAEAIIQHVTQNLVFLHDLMPGDIRERAKLWYDGGRKIAERFSSKHHVKPETAAGVIAVLSPQQDWFVNVAIADRTLGIYGKHQDSRWTPQMEIAAKDMIIRAETVAAKRVITAMTDAVKGSRLKDLQSPVDAAFWVRMFDAAHNDQKFHVIHPEGDTGDYQTTKSGDPGNVRWGSIGMVAKAIRIIRNPTLETIDSELGDMHKVRNFYNNIINPDSPLGDVTIDTHAVAAGMLQPFSGEAIPVAHNFGSGTQNDSVLGIKGTYGLFAEAYARAGEKRSLLPREMQSITWEAIRGIFSPESKRGDLPDRVRMIWRNYSDGQVPLDEARQQILKLTDGSAYPAWSSGRGRRYGGGADQGTGSARDARNLSEPVLSRRDSEPVDGGTGSSPAREIPEAGVGSLIGRSASRPHPDPVLYAVRDRHTMGMFDTPSDKGVDSSISPISDTGYSDTKARNQWSRAATGTPITVQAWHAAGGSVESRLMPEAEAKIGRKSLLGNGWYGARDKDVSATFGKPELHSVTLNNPYVIETDSASDLLRLSNDQLQAIKDAGHDGIIVKPRTSKIGAHDRSPQQLVVFGKDDAPKPDVAKGNQRETSVKPSAGSKKLRPADIEKKYGNQTFPAGELEHREVPAAGFLSGWESQIIHRPTGEIVHRNVDPVMDEIRAERAKAWMDSHTAKASPIPEVPHGTLSRDRANIPGPSKTLKDGVVLRAIQGDKPKYEGGTRYFMVSAFKGDREIASAYFDQKPDGVTLHPDNIFTEPEFRRTGLMRSLFDYAKELGKRPINTNTATPDGRRFLDSYLTSDAPKADDYESFAKEYRENFRNMSKYKPDEVGSSLFSERMAKMEDAHPDWVARIEAEEEAAAGVKPGRTSPTTITPMSQPEGAGRTPPQQESPKATSGKEPWQMTRDEFRDSTSVHFDRNDGQQATRVESMMQGMRKGWVGPDIDMTPSERYAPRAPARGWATHHKMDKPGNHAYVVSNADLVDDFKVKPGTKPLAHAEITREGQSVHEALIEQALKDGKQVPPEVLKDYPNLQKSFDAPAPAETGGTASPVKKPTAEPKTTGQQKGLLGESFDGGITGSKTGKLFGDTSKSDLEGPPITREGAEAKIAAKFKADSDDNGTGRLFAVRDNAAYAGVDADADAKTLYDAQRQWITLGTESPYFRKWFGDSKATRNRYKYQHNEKTGEVDTIPIGTEPMVLYHGTKGDFTEFAPGEGGAAGPGIYLATNPKKAGVFAGETKGAKSLPVYAKIENPRKVEFNEMLGDMDKLNAEARANGHDGLYLPWVGEYVAFYPEQIKSATGNRGTFDPDNADIRFAVRDRGEDAVPPAPKNEADLDNSANLYGSEAPRDVTSTKLRLTNRDRAERGLEPVPEAEPQSRQGWNEQAEAMMAKDPDIANRLIAEILDNPRSVNTVERLVLQRHRRTLANGYAEATDRLVKAIDENNPAAIIEARAVAQRYEDQLDVSEKATKIAGREWGREGVAQQVELLADFSLAALTRRHTVATGTKPTESELTQLREMSKRAIAAEKIIAENAQRQADLAAQLETERLLRIAAEDKAKAAPKVVIHKTVPPTSKDYGTKNRIFTREAYEKAKRKLLESNTTYAGLPVDKLAALAEMAAFHIEAGSRKLADYSAALLADIGEKFKPHLEEIHAAAEKAILTAKIKARMDEGATNRQLQPYIQELALDLIRKEGIKTREPLLDALHKAVQEIDPEITRNEVRDILSGYGDFKPLNKSEDLNTLRDIKQQAQKLAQLEALEAGKAPLKTGVERQPPNDETRGIQKQVNEAKKKAGIVTGDPARQLKTALDAMKTRAKNTIADLQTEIDTKQRIVKGKRITISDAELDGMKKQIAELRKQHAEIFEKPALTDEQRLTLATRAAKANLESWQERLANAKKGVFDTAKPAAPLTGPELDAIRANINAVKQEVTYLEQAANPPKSNTERRAEAIQKQIERLDAKIKAGDVTVKGPKQGPEPEKIVTLKQQRDALSKKLAEMRDNDPILQAQDAVKRYEDQAAEWERRAAEGEFVTDPTGNKVPATAEVEAAKQRAATAKAHFEQLRNADPVFQKRAETVSNAAYRAMVARRMAEIQERIARDDYDTRKPDRKYTLDQESIKAQMELKKLNEYFAEKRKIAERKAWPMWKKAAAGALEPLNLAKAIKSAYDLSAPLRQGVFFTFGHPIRNAANVGKMIQSAGYSMGTAKEAAGQGVGSFLKYLAYGNDTKAREIDARIRSHQDFAEAEAMGLEITELEGLNFSKQEEAIRSRLSDYLPGIRQSNRAFTTMMNLQRMQMYSLMKAAAPNATPAELKKIARFVNTATGRGSFGKTMDQSVHPLSAVIWSPRLLASRFQLVTAQPLYGGTMRTRKLMAIEYARFLGGLAAVYGAFQLAGLFMDDDEKPTVEMDPRSSDFGKVKMGNTRMDPMGGMAQVTVLLSRFATGETKKANGKIVPLAGDKISFGGDDLFATGSKFLRSKLSPVVSIPLDWRIGRNAVGEKITTGTTVRDTVVPLSFQEIADVMQEQGVPKGAALQILSMFGMGMQNYDAKKKKRD